MLWDTPFFLYICKQYTDLLWSLDEHVVYLWYTGVFMYSCWKLCVGPDGTWYIQIFFFLIKHSNFLILKFLQRTNDFVLKFEFLDVISENTILKLKHWLSYKKKIKTLTIIFKTNILLLPYMWIWLEYT